MKGLNKYNTCLDSENTNLFIFIFTMVKLCKNNRFVYFINLFVNPLALRLFLDEKDDNYKIKTLNYELNTVNFQTFKQIHFNAKTS